MMRAHHGRAKERDVYIWSGSESWVFGVNVCLLCFFFCFFFLGVCEGRRRVIFWRDGRDYYLWSVDSEVDVCCDKKYGGH